MTIVVMPLTERLLFRCPMLFLEDFGTAEFTGEEVQRLREYLLKGGFVWIDDAWGSYAWTMIVREIQRILQAEHEAPALIAVADIHSRQRLRARMQPETRADTLLRQIEVAERRRHPSRIQEHDAIEVLGEMQSRLDVRQKQVAIGEAIRMFRAQ